MKTKKSSTKKPKKTKTAAKSEASCLTGFRLRIYPSPAQEKVLLGWVGSKRWVYNTALHRIEHQEEMLRRKEFWMLGQIDPPKFDQEFYSFKPSPIDISRDITDWRDGKPMPMLSSKDILDPNFSSQTPTWLGQIPRTIITQTLRDLQTAFARFKEGVSEKPTFIQASQTQSCRLQLDARAPTKKDGTPSPPTWVTHWQDNQLFIPFLNSSVTFKNKQDLPKNLPKTLTITKESTGYWYVSFAVVDTSPIWDKSLTLDQNGNPRVLGLDQNLGDETRIVDSEGNTIERERFNEKSASHIAYLQQKSAKQEKASNRYNDNQRRIARLHKKAKNKRKDFVEKASTTFVKHTAVIGLEDLDNQGMMEQNNKDKEKLKQLRKKTKAQKEQAEKERSNENEKVQTSSEKSDENQSASKPVEPIFKNMAQPKTAMAQGFVKQKTQIKEDKIIERVLLRSKLAKSLADAGFGMFKDAIVRKAKKHGREVLFCDRFTATSPVCYECGFKVEKSVFTLDVKEWFCPSCNTFHLRDHTAAINIKYEALALRDQILRVFPKENSLVGLSQAEQTQEFLLKNPHIKLKSKIDKTLGRSTPHTPRGGELVSPAKRGRSLSLRHADGTHGRRDRD